MGKFIDNWSKCTRSCEYGTRYRTRKVIQWNTCGGKPCTGPWSQTELCNKQCCPKDGAWEVNWQAWDKCSKTCGGGTQTRRRKVIHYPECGGKQIPKSEVEQSRDCNVAKCPID